MLDTVVRMSATGSHPGVTVRNSSASTLEATDRLTERRYNGDSKQIHSALFKPKTSMVSQRRPFHSKSLKQEMPGDSRHAFYIGELFQVGGQLISSASTVWVTGRSLCRQPAFCKT